MLGAVTHSLHLPDVVFYVKPCEGYICLTYGLQLSPFFWHGLDCNKPHIELSGKIYRKPAACKGALAERLREKDARDT